VEAKFLHSDKLSGSQIFTFR